MGTLPLPHLVSQEVGGVPILFAVNDQRHSETFVVSAILCHRTTVYFHGHADIVHFKRKFILSWAVICGLEYCQSANTKVLLAIKLWLFYAVMNLRYYFVILETGALHRYMRL